MSENEKPFSILIVDDNTTNLKVLNDYLLEQNYQILIAEDGESALEQVQYSLPDLILLDVMMPGIDGFETCRRLKQNDATKDVPVIFMTALSDTPYILKGFAAGGVDYLTKPLQQEEVCVRVRNHMRNCRLYRSLQTEVQMRRQVEEELRETNAGKDRLFSIVAHDLKSPMSIVQLSSDVLLDLVRHDPALAKPELIEMAQILNESSVKIGALLVNLLTWAQSQMGRVVMQKDSVNLNELLKTNVGLAVISARIKKITIVNLVTESLQFYGDHRIIDTVLRNLLGNAVKFSPFGQTVTISAEIREKRIIVAIRNLGEGIPDDKIPTLFQLNQNKSTQGTSGEIGTGLGLPLCYEMIERSGGKLWCESMPGEGSTFFFSLLTEPDVSELPPPVL